MKARTAILIGLALLLAPLFNLEAQIPGTLSYQAFLSDSLGVPKADGTYTITFSLYDVETGGTALWTETKDLDVKQGLFYTHLGPFPSSLHFDQPYWLGIQEGSEAELTPRIPLTSVGYSFMALRSDSAQYAVLADSARYTTHALLADSAQHAVQADTAKVATSALAAADLADNAITSGKIADGTVAMVDLADNAVTTAKILDGTVTTDDLADNAVIGAKILDGAIDAGDLADNAVTDAKIADGTITGADINTSADLSIASLITSGTVAVDSVAVSSGASVGGSLTASALDVSGTVNVGGLFTTNGGHIVKVAPETADYTATTNDRIILCNPTIEDMTVSLPPAADAVGLVLTIKNIEPIGEIAVYIDPYGEEAIDGESASMEFWGSEFVTIVSDGTAWWVISASMYR